MLQCGHDVRYPKKKQLFTVQSLLCRARRQSTHGQIDFVTRCDFLGIEDHKSFNHSHVSILKRETRWITIVNSRAHLKSLQLVCHLRFSEDLSESALSRWAVARPRVHPVSVHLCDRASAEWTSDSDSDSLDRCRCWRALDSRSKHCPGRPLSVASGAVHPHDLCRMARVSVPAHGCCRLSIEAIWSTLAAWPGSWMNGRRREEK